MKRFDPELRAHLDWLGLLQPYGLVVSAPALVHAGVVLNPNDKDGQQRLAGCVEERVFGTAYEPEPWLPDFEEFARSVLGWSFSPKAFAGPDECADDSSLVVHLHDYGESLKPDFAVKHWPPPEEGSAWQLLVRIVKPEQEFDAAERGSGTLDATAQGRMERLLRSTGVRAGLLFNGKAVRLVSAPHGENSGWVDFKVADMLLTAGRPIVGALRMLLSQSRLLTVPQNTRLAVLLSESRNYQNVVSERLAEQVLHGLYELLRGFQAAHDSSGQVLLTAPLKESPDMVYRAMLTVILRLVFLLYGEQRELFSQDKDFLQFYSLTGLYELLREDAAQYPDTMGQRYGAWAQLVVLFRMIHDGADAGEMMLPPRQGTLFDPSRFGFLERVPGAEGPAVQVPLVPDGTVYRVLQKLLVLDGEKISYRSLDVEQIGSVYETMMGFRLETATGISLAIRSLGTSGASSTIDLEQLLEVSPLGRKKWILDRTDRKITASVEQDVKESRTVDDLFAALDRVVDKHASPDLVMPGAMILQPSLERRRSGSHYTPRTLTEPIVRKTLGPVLQAARSGNGGRLTAGQILDIKVCDPAMGSGAFLVESCRQLADALVEAWHDGPANDRGETGEDEVVVARRIVAQRCLCGVDRNPMAVELAKMSLWLATLAKEHPLTFLDHAFRHGDSLLGLTRQQIESFHWLAGKRQFQEGLEVIRTREHLARVAKIRARIRSARHNAPQSELKELWDSAEDELNQVRLLGDLVLAAFFSSSKARAKELRRKKYARSIQASDFDPKKNPLSELREADKPLASFHWEIEFPEVFERERPGFDAIVGNPPFAGKDTVTASNVAQYPNWLKTIHKGSHGNADLAAHFFRRSFALLRKGGNLGLVATNTISQGDTRSTGLRAICTIDGEIYDATRRLRWPGQAAVVVSVVHIHRGRWNSERKLDGVQLPSISAFLTVGSNHDDPARLIANKNQSFQGTVILGMGFTFDDTDKKGVASSVAEMCKLIELDSKNRKAIFPYIGGAEFNSSPDHAHHRYVINFWDYPLRRDPSTKLSWFTASETLKSKWFQSGVVPYDYPDPVADDWPDLLSIVRNRVRPFRAQKKTKTHRERWWRYPSSRPGLHRAIKKLNRVLAVSKVSQHAAFSFLSNAMVYADTLILFPFDTFAAFCLLQSRPHGLWARCFGSTMKDDLRYTSSDIFETFPLPKGWSTNACLEEAGKNYYRFRAQLMINTGLGLTKTYNQFHRRNAHDSEITRLRKLHDEMDRAVLSEYGWDDVPLQCEFLCEPGIEEATAPTRFWRYRWPNEVQDEILGRLINLNAERAKEERESEKLAAIEGDSQKRLQRIGSRKFESRRRSSTPFPLLEERERQ